MSINFDSPNKEFAGQTNIWVSGDTKKLYKSNLKHRYDILEKYGWVDNYFTYTFNSHGFRCGEFTDSPTIMFLGCSHTMGIGIPEHCRWSDIVANSLNLKCANLGIGGGSTDTAFRLCYGWIDRIKPTIVVFREPPGVRLEIITRYGFMNIGIWNREDSFFRYWAQCEDNTQLNLIKNSMAMEYICQQRNIKFVKIPEINDTSDFGRDLLHPGIKANQDVANLVLSLI